MNPEDHSSVEYGAIRGMYAEWDDGDHAAARAQAVSMEAQKRYNKTPDISVVTGAWSELTDEQRSVVIALENGSITHEDAARAFDIIANRIR